MLRDFFNRLYPEVGLVGKEYLAASPLRLVPQGAVLHHEGLPFVLVRLEQPLLGPLEGKPQAVQPVQATATAQTGAESFPDKLPDSSPVPERKTRLLAGLVRGGLGLVLLLPTRLVFSAPQSTGQPVPDDPHQASLTAR